MKWEEITQDPRYINAAPEIKARMQDTFFNNYIAPKAREKGLDVEQIRLDFNERTKVKDVAEPNIQITPEQAEKISQAREGLSSPIGLMAKSITEPNVAEAIRLGAKQGLERIASGATLGGYDWLADKLGIDAKQRKQEYEDLTGGTGRVANVITELAGGLPTSIKLIKGISTGLSSIPKIGTTINKATLPAAGAIEGGVASGFSGGDIKEGATIGGLLGAAIPASIAGVKKLAPYLASVASGVSDKTLRKAYEIGEKGSKEAQRIFQEQRTGRAGINEVLDDAEDALRRIKDKAIKKYQGTKEALFADKTPLDVSDILDTTRKEIGSTMYEGLSIIPKEEANKITEIARVVDRFKDKNTIEGLDAMKRAVQSVNINPLEQRQAGRIQTSIANTIKDTIKRQNPAYKDLQKEYSDVQDVINSIRQELKVGSGNRATTTRSIMQAMRDNVNANFGRKADLLSLLEQEGNKELSAGLAGQELSPWIPRGLARIVPQALATAGATMAVPPSALLTIPASSPRLAGGIAYSLGKLSGKASPTTKKALLADILGYNEKEEE